MVTSTQLITGAGCLPQWDHCYGQDARRLPGIRRSLGRRPQIGGTPIRSSNRNPSHLPPPRINADTEENPPWRVRTLGPWYKGKRGSLGLTVSCKIGG